MEACEPFLDVTHPGRGTEIHVECDGPQLRQSGLVLVSTELDEDCFYFFGGVVHLRIRIPWGWSRQELLDTGLVCPDFWWSIFEIG